MAALDAFLQDVTAALGAEWVNTGADTRHRYGEHTLPAPNRSPAAVLYPGNTAEVQAIVRAANVHRVPLYPISTGNNIGLGSRAPVHAGQVVLDLGRRMNRILEVNEALGYCVVEPGVSFQQMHDELVRRGDRLMISATSGPPEGGLIGNALEKGGGYGPYFDHFGMTCGMEIVLGSGAIIRTGDGSLESDNLVNWHVSKYSYGPILDGLFAQSNYGIVTRMGMWLMPRPPVVRSFHVTFGDDDDLEALIELARPLKLTNFVPTLFRVANDLYLIGTHTTSPEFAASGGKRSISAAARRELQRAHGLGSWTLSGAFYGPSIEAVEPMIARVKAHFAQSPKARFISHDEALAMPALAIAIDAFSGRPGTGELGLLKWRPGGGNVWFTPGTPVFGKITNDCQKIARAIYEKHGMDFMVMNVCSARFARGLHVMTFNREDPDEAARAAACYRELAAAFAARGISVGRAPSDFQGLHMDLLQPSFAAACRSIKAALDPAGVLAPGRYGI